MGTNPFTGEAMTVAPSCDPGPRTSPPVPARLPFEHFVLPSDEHWERHYLALDLALSDEAPLENAQWDDDDAWVGVMDSRGLCEEPLYGGCDSDDPKYLWRVPTRLVERFAALDSASIEPLARAWSLHSPSPPAEPERFLLLFAELARAGTTRAKGMYVWEIHPYYRDDSGRA
jgi:hypothetical protein